MVTKQKSKKKNIKKKFFEVKSDLTNANISLYGAEPADFDGKSVKVDLTRSLRGKGYELKLKLKADGNEINSSPVSLSLAGSYIRRILGKGVDYAEDSFETECKDVIVRVKPFMVTRNRVSKSVLKALRTVARKELENYLRTRTSEEIFSELMSNKLQKQLSLKLRKIYPLALCEIRVFSVERDKESEEVSEENKAEEKEVKEKK